MRYKGIIFISFLLSLIGLICLNAISQELPFLMDLAQLKLEVTNTEVVGQISTKVTTLSAKEGYKLVVVTLKGIITHPCSIFMETREFSAIYGIGTTEFDVIKASAIAKDNSWSITGSLASVKYYIREPSPIILKVAVSLPEQITNFFVRYPALAKGKATISAQAGE